MATRWVVAACAGALTWGLEREAEACGGTFCDAGPTAMPVEQTGETILFVLDEGTVEAHIQIQYDPETEAERFAWVIPVMALPEFAVGSQPLFDRMLAQSSPSYGSASWREECWDPATPDGGDECNEPPAGEDGGGLKLDAGAGGDGPEVVDRRTVGAFEVTVLDGGTAESVAQWLTDNGYQMDDAATPILGEYLAGDFMFVAVKLATDAEAADVHPIVLRIPGDEPCVPIKLTRIAAQEDLRLRVLFLARSRVVPDNYAHVVLNDVRLDWITQAANYDAIVTQAVDGGGSRAWVTEYAGPSDVVDTTGLVGEQWNATAFVGLDAAAAIDELQRQGLRDYEGAWSEPRHPLVEGLLREFSSPPDNVDPEAFHACPTCDPAALAAATFDDLAFALALQERVIDPAAHAEELFATWESLTRMYTTISPEEMLIDPTFVENHDAQTATRLQHMGLAASWCDGTRVFRLPDDRLIRILDTTTWPAFPGMPAHERIEQWGPAGAPIVVEDRRDEIDRALETWNEEAGGVREPPLADICGGTDGLDGDFDFDTFPSEPRDTAAGCACRASTPPPLVAVGVLGLLLLGLTGRRSTCLRRPCSDPPPRRHRDSTAHTSESSPCPRRRRP
jgi:hypothetical protein